VDLPGRGQGEHQPLGLDEVAEAGELDDEVALHGGLVAGKARSGYPICPAGG